MNRKKLMSRWQHGVDDARAAGEKAAGEVRTRIAGRPERGPWGSLLIGALGAAAGAATLYLLDPDRGRRRRNELRDRGTALARRAGREAARGTRMAGSLLGGKLEALKHGGENDLMPNDAALSKKVESELFRDASIPKGSINVNAEQGVVVLRGEVDDADLRERIEVAARRIPGVWEVRNLLHLPGEPAPTGR
jgi:gas vesicle protein